MIHKTKLYKYRWYKNVFIKDCPKEFIEYENDTVRTCLLAELTPRNHSDAVSHCQAKKGDLIRLDSTEKYQMLQDVVAGKLKKLLFIINIIFLRFRKIIWNQSINPFM